MKAFEHINQKPLDGKQDKDFFRIELLHNFGSLAYRYAFSAKDNKNNFYAIPVCAGNIMKYNTESKMISFAGNLENTDFAYTGGVFDARRNCIWGFPRNSDCLLRVDTEKDYVEEISLGIKFGSIGIHGAHHYSGVLTDNYIYCPPRGASYGILKISLDTLHAEIIPLDVYAGMNTHYSGSVLHPNGDIFLLPSAHNRLTVFNPRTEKIDFIGEKTDYMNFGCVVWTDGNIYGFCEKGIVKIDVQNRTIEIINHFQSAHAFYGTVIHPNGRLYAFSGNSVYEYNPVNNKATVRAKFHDLSGNYVYNTMGEIMSDGNIYLTPCQGRFFMRYLFI